MNALDCSDLTTPFSLRSSYRCEQDLDSSGGSTSSLLSVLEHESYDSLTDSDTEERECRGSPKLQHRNVVKNAKPAWGTEYHHSNYEDSDSQLSSSIVRQVWNSSHIRAEDAHSRAGDENLSSSHVRQTYSPRGRDDADLSSTIVRHVWKSSHIRDEGTENNRNSRENDADEEFSRTIDVKKQQRETENMKFQRRTAYADKQRHLEKIKRQRKAEELKQRVAHILQGRQREKEQEEREAELAEKSKLESEAPEVSESYNSVDERTSVDPMSPWQQWLVQKTKENKALARKKHKQTLEMKEKLKQTEEENELKHQKSEENRKEWIHKKSHEEKLRTKLEKQKLNDEKEEKEQKESQTNEKAQQIYKEWTHQKQVEFSGNKKKEDDNKRKEEEKLEERKRLADKKYNEWCEKAKSRPKSALMSYGYLSGRLRGYHDTNAYPAPSYTNPNTWVEPEVPDKPTKKTKKKKVPTATLR